MLQVSCFKLIELKGQSFQVNILGIKEYFKNVILCV